MGTQNTGMVFFSFFLLYVSVSAGYCSILIWEVGKGGRSFANSLVNFSFYGEFVSDDGAKISEILNIIEGLASNMHQWVLCGILHEDKFSLDQPWV